MPEILEIILVATLSVIAGLWAVFRIILPKYMDAAIRRIEHSQNQDIKHLESRLELHSTALFNSIDIANRIEGSYRKKTIDATSTLWNEFLRIKNEFAPLIAIGSTLTDDEFVGAMSAPSKENSSVSTVLEEYSSFQHVIEKITGADETVSKGTEIAIGIGTASNKVHETTIFVSERLTEIFDCMVNVNSRLGFLVSQGNERGEGKTWKVDPIFEELVLRIFPRDVWEKITNMKLAGLKTLVGLLEQQFVLEAKKSMRGFEDLADTVSEVSQIIQEEETRARWRSDYL